jgi:hypothetical protein
LTGGWAAFPFLLFSIFCKHCRKSLNLRDGKTWVPMKTAATAKAAGFSAAEGSQAPVYATVLIATVDPDIRREMRELLEAYPVRVLWAKGVEEVRGLLSKERITACFCASGWSTALIGTW